MRISFECYCPTQWGQSLYIIGSLTELGTWDIDKAIPLKVVSNEGWRVDIDIKSKSQKPNSYKYFMKDENQNKIFWEYGENREFTIPKTRFANLYYNDSWRFFGNNQYVWTKSAFSKVIFKRNPEDIKKYTLPPKVENVLELKVTAPRVGVDYFLGIIGEGNILGNWSEKNILPLNSSEFPSWKIAFNKDKLSDIITYKYVIVNKKNGKIATWEEGDNRTLNLNFDNPKTRCQVDDNLFRFPEDTLKKAGVSLPVFSIRTKKSFGVGEFTDINKVVDWSLSTGLKMIQVLPVNDTISTKSFVDSYPYKSISVFALHPLYLNIFKIGKLKDAKANANYKKLQAELNKNNDVDYNNIIDLKLNYGKILFKEKHISFLKSKQFIEFYINNKNWLKPYAAFCYLRDKMKTGDFTQWKEYKLYNSDKVQNLFKIDSKPYFEISFWYFIQFHLNRQLKEASNYARNNGVALKGDIPIGISRHSVDAWVSPHLYHFNGQAGAPPDDFSIDGQNWGFPTYNWKEMEKDNFQWWRERLSYMSKFFDAYRIDHILGFFRIWEIPINAVQGILGYFRPALPLSANELSQNGINFDYDRMCKPYIRGHFLNDIFGEDASEVIEKYLIEVEYGVFELSDEFNTQQLIYNYFVGTGTPEELTKKDKNIMWGLIRLIAEVLMIPENDSTGLYHPRISMQSTYSYNELDDYLKEKLKNVYIHYFYHRHEQFWKEQALQKLPALVDATNMLICGEDLGMIPATVPEVMNQFGILSLEIQRMPKDDKKDFAHPADAPHFSVCTTSTHDMSTIRGWWEEDRIKTKEYYNQQLGKYDEMPYFAEPWICKEIINQHLHSPAMWTVFPIQDLLAIDKDLRLEDTHAERINEPSNPRHYWKYRMHLYMEDLLKEKDFNQMLENMVNESNRNTDY